MSKEIIQTADAPRPLAGYSQAVKAGGFIFVSGQGPFDPATGDVRGSTIQEQTRQCLANVEAILKAAGSSMGKVVSATFILAEEGDFPGMNEEWGKWFPKDPPERHADIHRRDRRGVTRRGDVRIRVISPPSKSCNIPDGAPLIVSAKQVQSHGGNMKHIVSSGLFLIACALMAPACMGADEQFSDSISAQAFVQKFYDWYLQEGKREQAMDPLVSALKEKPELFDAPLAKALNEDLAASAKSPDEVVGLDFDPFLNAQDTCDPYTTGKVSRDGDSYQVQVFGHGCSDQKPGQSDVTAVVKEKRGSWMFVNFLYPGNGDLLTVLQALKKEREHPSN